MVSVALFAADEDSVLVRLGLREAGLAATGAYVMEVQSEGFDLREFPPPVAAGRRHYDFVHPVTGSARWLDELKRVPYDTTEKKLRTAWVHPLPCAHASTPRRPDAAESRAGDVGLGG
jgi:hypothetical protein